jgi:hypothetical protein
MVSIGNIRASLYGKTVMVIDILISAQSLNDWDTPDRKMIVFFTYEGLSVLTDLDGVDGI